jgi:hypothetical protein
MCSDQDCCKLVWDKKERRMIAPCPYANWDGDTPPRCKQAVAMLLLEVGEESYIPYWYQIKSTAMSPYKKFKKVLGLRIRALTGKRRRATLPPAKPCMFTFHLGTELKQNDAGDAYIPTFSNLQEVEDEAMLKALVGVAVDVKDMRLASDVDGDEAADDNQETPAKDDF